MALPLRKRMTLYSKDEPFIVGVDFDGTVTTKPEGGMDFPPPQQGFVDFYNHIHEHNYAEPDNQILIVIHTARDLDNIDNWTYVKDYLCRYQLNEVFLPKRDGLSIKNNLNKKKTFPVHYTVNSKIPCSCYVDDLNIGVPKIDESNLDWPQIEKLIFEKIEYLKNYWASKEVK